MAIQSSVKSENNYTLRLSNKSAGVWNWRFLCLHALLSVPFSALFVCHPWRADEEDEDGNDENTLHAVWWLHALWTRQLHLETVNTAIQLNAQCRKVCCSYTTMLKRWTVLTANSAVIRVWTISTSNTTCRVLCLFFNTEIRSHRSVPLYIVYQPPSCFRSTWKTRLFHLAPIVRACVRAWVRACVCVLACLRVCACECACVCVNRL